MTDKEPKDQALTEERVREIVKEELKGSGLLERLTGILVKVARLERRSTRVL
jgi:hypothetical protein